jgi:signal transduction histidine kinase
VFGLRARLLGSLVLTAAVTLGVAALALLPPLRSRLRTDSLKLARTTVAAAKPTFGSIPLHDDLPSLAQVIHAEDTLRRNNSGARVVLWSVDPLRVIHATDSDTDTEGVLLRTVVRGALATGKGGVYTGAENRGEIAVGAEYTHDGVPFVLVVVRPLAFVSEAIDVVQSAFLVAAIVGVAVALLLGIVLSSRLLRRLRILRYAVSGFDQTTIAQLVEPGEGGGRDEIADLANTFATMQGRLLKQEAARRAFVATSSHELRTPLASLDGMLELLGEDLASDPVDVADARLRVAQAREQSRRLASLAGDLLDLSRIDAELELRNEPVELAEVVRAVSAEFELRGGARNVPILFDTSGGRMRAQGDPTAVARIVRILLDNALRVAPAGSTVTVRIAEDGASAQLDVCDEGPGVAPADRERIFERFERGSDRSAEGGFGLGLAIGRELAQRMHGTLELLDSDGESGATFRVRLPRANLAEL